MKNQYLVIENTAFKISIVMKKNVHKDLVKRIKTR